jgi:hypothetical protein
MRSYRATVEERGVTLEDATTHCIELVEQANGTIYVRLPAEPAVILAAPGDRAYTTMIMV